MPDCALMVYVMCVVFRKLYRIILDSAKMMVLSGPMGFSASCTLM